MSQLFEKLAKQLGEDYLVFSWKTLERWAEQFLQRSEQHSRLSLARTKKIFPGYHCIFWDPSEWPSLGFGGGVGGTLMIMLDRLFRALGDRFYREGIADGLLLAERDNYFITSDPALSAFLQSRRQSCKAFPHSILGYVYAFRDSEKLRADVAAFQQETPSVKYYGRWYYPENEYSTLATLLEAGLRTPLERRRGSGGKIPSGVKALP